MCDLIICIAVSNAAFAHVPVWTYAGMQESANRRCEWRENKPPKFKIPQLWHGWMQTNLMFHLNIGSLAGKLRLQIPSLN